MFPNKDYFWQWTFMQMKDKIVFMVYVLNNDYLDLHVSIGAPCKYVVCEHMKLFLWYSDRVMSSNVEEASIKMPEKHPLYMLQRVKRQTAPLASAVTQQPTGYPFMSSLKLLKN